MRSTDTHIESQIKRYIDHGYSLESAARAVDSLTLNRHSHIVERVKNKLAKEKK